MEILPKIELDKNGPQPSLESPILDKVLDSKHTFLLHTKYATDKQISLGSEVHSLLNG